jgi:hypothetical protein
MTGKGGTVRRAVRRPFLDGVALRERARNIFVLVFSSVTLLPADTHHPSRNAECLA